MLSRDPSDRAEMPFALYDVQRDGARKESGQQNRRWIYGIRRPLGRIVGQRRDRPERSQGEELCADGAANAIRGEVEAWDYVVSRSYFSLRLGSTPLTTSSFSLRSPVTVTEAPAYLARSFSAPESR